MHPVQLFSQVLFDGVSLVFVACEFGHKLERAFDEIYFAIGQMD